MVMQFYIMKMKHLYLFLIFFSFWSIHTGLASGWKKKGCIDVDAALENARCQYLYMKNGLKKDSVFPKTYDHYVGQMKTSNSSWWCSGFYPGTLFYLYEATGDKALYNEGIRMLALLKPEQYNVDTHDVGFMMYCSYGHAYKINPEKDYKEILLNSANSLLTRFNPAVGCIKSHNRKLDDYIVIIDNMMNLELLLWAAQTSGNEKYYNVAVTHANTTLKNHFRADYSLYHALNYDSKTGKVKAYQGGQGYSKTSAWSRGQAWGLYGYTMMYRFTKNATYLEQAVRIAEFILNHPNMPADLIPYWDFNAPDIPEALRDASAAAISCSALLELSGYVSGKQSRKYYKAAEKMLCVLSSPEYTAAPQTNGGFILKHSVGNIPAGTEVDVPLTYADYYYVEALCRYKALNK